MTAVKTEDVRIATEVLTIEEVEHGETVVLLNEEVLGGLSTADRVDAVRSLCILARDELCEELSVPENYRSKVKTAQSPDMQDRVVVIQMLVEQTSGDFTLVRKFGGKVDKNTTMDKAILHCIQIVLGVELQLLG